MLTHWLLSQTWPAPQTRLHAPQLAGSVVSCTHLLLQLVLPGGHRHWLLRHCPPGPQELPQAPQLLGSAWVKVQAPLHSVWPPKHEAWQLKPVQSCPAWHMVPQLPQFDGSVRDTQRLPQRRKPLGHWQVELLHVPGPHELPHALQFAGSLVVLVHRPLQTMKPGGQPIWQTPPTQARPAPHATPQPPQLAGSLAVVTHWPLQLVWPGAHWQEPDWQLLPPVQTTPQPPQLLLSALVLVHTPLQTC